MAMTAPRLSNPAHTVPDLRECYFYHTTDVPGHGTIAGEWDLRANVRAYLGGVELQAKRVLEIGTASGFLCFAMEGMGAEVVAYDLSPEHAQDVVPYAGRDYPRARLELQAHTRRLNNAYWHCHHAFRSRARMVYGTVYALPEEIGLVDIVTFGCVLLHVRDPFLALSNAAQLVPETIIVTEPLVVRSKLKRAVQRWLAGPSLRFYPNFRTGEPKETWWVLSPEIIQSFLGVLGFEKQEVTYHTQIFRGRPVQLFTIVGRRTATPA
jgi:2-polyprenyl-3-methyl-5-hydroxy-6-metoxy-1,4-benzoquinol methylase